MPKRTPKPVVAPPPPSAPFRPHPDSPKLAEAAHIGEGIQTCIICGTLRSADVCAVDGFRFTGDL